MDEEEDLDIAAAMGFGSFGGTKKRKYDHASSPKAASKEDASGANTTQLGVRTKKVATEELDDAAMNDDANQISAPATSTQKPNKAPKPAAASGLADFLARAQTLPDKSTNTPDTRSAPSQARQTAQDEMISFGGPAISKGELNALKFGVQNEYGDTAYFLPNFVEDPWEKLMGGK
ncbi:hypothetical protein HBI71_068460 [Parastagonospora nodorum]|nr:hypothetical protein HBI71_068460 [Parastagonospora nodorum]